MAITTTNMPQVQVAMSSINGKSIPAVTSLQIAEAFGKAHFNVLNEVRNTASKCSESFNALNFQVVDYIDSKGETRPMYALSKDAFMLVVMGYTTTKAMSIKEVYIQKFNEMEEALRNPAMLAIPQNYAEALRALANTFEQKALIQQKLDAASPKARSTMLWWRIRKSPSITSPVNLPEPTAIASKPVLPN